MIAKRTKRIVTISVLMLAELASCKAIGSTPPGRDEARRLKPENWTMVLSGKDCGFQLQRFHVDDEGYYIRFRLDRDLFRLATNGVMIAELRSSNQWIRVRIECETPEKMLYISSESFPRMSMTVNNEAEEGLAPADLVDPIVRAFLSTDGSSFSYESTREVYSTENGGEVRYGGGRGGKHKGVLLDSSNYSYMQERLLTYERYRSMKNDISRIKVVRTNAAPASAGAKSQVQNERPD